MANTLFRQSALDTLATPEELDKMVQVTSRKGWIALAGLMSLVIAALVFGIFGTIPTILNSSGILIRPEGVREARASEAGQLTELSVKVGDTVTEGQVIGRLETAAKTQVEVRSPAAGTVLEVAAKNQPLKPDTLIAQVEANNRPLQGLIFLSLTDGKRVRPGMKVQLSPANVRPEESGYMLGTVTSVTQFPVTAERLAGLISSKELVQAFAASGPNLLAEVRLETDPNTFSGFKWTTPRGPQTAITNGTIFQGSLVLGEQRPISLVLPILKEVGQ